MAIGAAAISPEKIAELANKKEERMREAAAAKEEIARRNKEISSAEIKRKQEELDRDTSLILIKEELENINLAQSKITQRKR